MKPTLFLHVGYPKTGTSAIQWMLAVNRARLAELGFHYPLMGHAQSHQPGGNGVELANLLKGRPSPQGQADQQRLLDLLRAGEGNLILSSELLAQAKPPLLEDFLQKATQAGADIRVIFYLRPYPSLIPSVWNQMVKSHGYAKGFAEYQASLQPPHPQRRSLETYLRLLGREALCIRLFDRAQMIHNSIHHDFLLAGLGLTLEALQGFDLTGQEVNSSLSQDDVLVQLEVNRLRQGLPPAPVCGDVLQALGAAGPPLRLSPHQQAELDGRFGEDLAFYDQQLQGQHYPLAQGQGGEPLNLTPTPAQRERAARLARLLGRPGALGLIKLLLRLRAWGGQRLLARWFR